MLHLLLDDFDSWEKTKKPSSQENLFLGQRLKNPCGTTRVDAKGAHSLSQTKQSVLSG